MSLTVTPEVESAVASSRHRLVFAVKGDLLEASRRCEAEVFLERFGNTRDQLDEEYGPYRDQSVFVSLVDDADSVVATARLIAPGARPLKTLEDCGREPWGIDGPEAARAAGIDPDTTWDVATISARGDSRRSVLASAALYHGLILTARAYDVTATVAGLDSRVRGLLAAVGLFYRPLPGTWPADYLGSPASTPVFAPFGRMLDEQRRDVPEGYRLVTLGIGLDGVAVPSLEQFRRTRVIDLRPSAAEPAEVQQVGRAAQA